MQVPLALKQALDPQQSPSLRHAGPVSLSVTQQVRWLLQLPFISAWIEGQTQSTPAVEATDSSPCLMVVTGKRYAQSVTLLQFEPISLLSNNFRSAVEVLGTRNGTWGRRMTSVGAELGLKVGAARGVADSCLGEPSPPTDLIMRVAGVVISITRASCSCAIAFEPNDRQIQLVASRDANWRQNMMLSPVLKAKI